jgi:hypothetical protein
MPSDSEPTDPPRSDSTPSDSAGSEHADPLSGLLDLFVYAPIGAFLHGPETVDDLAGKGRQDVANARFIGKVVVDRSIREGRERIGGVAEDVGQRWLEVVIAAARAAGVPFAASQDEPVGTEPESQDADIGGARLRIVDDLPESGDTGASDGAPDVDSLAIPGYDTLAASQVVPRLDDLGDDELEAVQDYERAHRGRMTILSRIAQLRAS